MKVNAEMILATGTTKDDLIAALDGVPGNAVVSVRVSSGDRFGPDTQYIKLTWEVGNGKSTYNSQTHGASEWGTGIGPR
jgi:hypothetical protein